MSLLQEMEMRGELAREPLTSGEVTRRLESIEERLEATNLESNSKRIRLEHAYDAIHFCARLALRVESYRIVNREGHHRVALESLADTLGIDNEDIDYFLGLSRERHDEYYDAAPVTDSELSSAIEAAAEMVEKLRAWLEVRVPGEL
jgi:hypothetical protein